MNRTKADLTSSLALAGVVFTGFENLSLIFTSGPLKPSSWGQSVGFQWNFYAYLFLFFAASDRSCFKTLCYLLMATVYWIFQWLNFESLINPSYALGYNAGSLDFLESYMKVVEKLLNDKLTSNTTLTSNDTSHVNDECKGYIYIRCNKGTHLNLWFWFNSFVFIWAVWFLVDLVMDKWNKKNTMKDPLFKLYHSVMMKYLLADDPSLKKKKSLVSEVLYEKYGKLNEQEKDKYRALITGMREA